MGLNAQTTVPTFTSGQVLTAAQQNQSARTGVPVFATTVERDAAFGGSQKTLAEGQLAYIEATNVVQYYDGAAWATVGPSSAGGLVFLTGAAFTSVASVSLAANTFSSTYRNYKIVLHVTAGASDSTATMRLRAGGTDDTNSSYLYAQPSLTATAATNNFNSNGTTSWKIVEYNSAIGGVMSVDLIAPQVAVRTFMSGTMSYSSASYNQITGTIGGMFNAATQFDACSFIFAANATGVYRVYGYADS
jgi:hypothetical protein